MKMTDFKARSIVVFFYAVFNLLSSFTQFIEAWYHIPVMKKQNGQQYTHNLLYCSNHVLVSYCSYHAIITTIDDYWIGLFRINAATLYFSVFIT